MVYDNLLGCHCPKPLFNALALEFKELMLKEMINSNLILQQTINFIKKVYKIIPLYIFFGSDESELKNFAKFADK